MAAKHIPAWGGGAMLARAVGVTPKAASKWLNGEAMPGRAKIMAIAEWLSVAADWLEYGTATHPGTQNLGDPDVKPLHKPLDAPEESNVEPGPPIVSTVRRIDIVGTAQLGPDGYWLNLELAEGFVETYSRDEDAYALRLKGDSMAPAIRNGWVAVCEPNHRLVPGEYVMVTTVDGQSMVKELLFENEEAISLMSVNSAYGERRTIPRNEIDRIHYVGNILAPSKVLGRY